MKIVAKVFEKSTLTVFTIAVVMLAGAMSYFGLGQLEDPEFTVKVAVVATPYPGASPEEVELEVTDIIEKAVQEIAVLKEIESYSSADLSTVKVIIKAEVLSHELPQVWDELRKRVSDAARELPPGAGPPMVFDDFGDVFGFLFALQSDGFTPAEMERYADDIKMQLSLIPGVATVELWGVQQQCVHLDVSEARLSQLGLSMLDVQNTLAQQNTVVQAGAMDLHGMRMRFEVTGEFTSPEEIGELVIPGRTLRGEGEGRLIRIRDVALVTRSYLTPSREEMRLNGRPSIGIAISNASGVNIVTLGRAIDRRLEQIIADLPVGVEIERISWQSDQVSGAINSFMMSLILAIAIVLGVLWLSMGLRSSIVVGLTGLLMVIIATFLVLSMIGEDLHRMSLGALIVAMGMMVDNAIVVADGVLTRMERGMDRMKAAIEAASQPSIPLLGATIVAVMAFYPIAASTENAGEYTQALFSVAGIALLVSWLFAITVAPLMCVALLPTPKGEAKDPYSGAMYRGFRRLLELSLRAKPLVVLIFVGALAASLFSFRWVDRMFFPAADRPQFMVDVWLPEGTRIETTSAALREMEEYFLKLEGVTAVSAFIGRGPPRFYLPVEPEGPNSSYAQLIVNTVDARAVNQMLPAAQAWADDTMAGAVVIARKYGLGPFKSWPIEARISGPAFADLDTLRELGEQAADVLHESPHAMAVRTNWRDRTPLVTMHFDQANARWTGVSRSDVASALRRSHDGTIVGLYREDDKLLPIVLRSSERDREQAARNLDILQIRPLLSSRSAPLSQVTSSIETGWRDPFIFRFNRKRTISAQGVPVGLATDFQENVRARIDAIELPPGYTLNWDGEYRSSRDAQKSLVPGVVPAFIVMAIVIVALFNNYRQPLIILCIVPFALIGVVVGLLVTGQPLGFVAILGAMSLAGMMVKNAVVLLDEINALKKAGEPEYDAVVNAAVARLRPVVLAAGTTVLGVIPLLGDVFWVSLAVVIMFGLAIGSVITMILVPVLYALFYRVQAPPSTAPTSSSAATD
ncbi:MAG: efflux RND transporter permease subunit [Phycisphaeraceae bacterium]|nr:MAG: efflux RND transporter permease subunit [Phycisphaeraceae bacterium]